MLSLALCTFNRERLLAQALASIESCQPPRREWEILVVDNKSSRRLCLRRFPRFRRGDARITCSLPVWQMQMAHELCEPEVRERGRTNPFAEGRGTGAEKLVRVYASCFRGLPDALDGIALRHDRTITEYATVSSMVEKGPVEDDSIAHEALYPSRVRPCAFFS